MLHCVQQKLRGIARFAASSVAPGEAAKTVLCQNYEEANDKQASCAAVERCSVKTAKRVMTSKPHALPSIAAVIICEKGHDKQASSQVK